MSSAYRFDRTSSKTANTDDLWLDPPEDRSTALTRKILRTQIVDNVHSNLERVKACVVHQKRHAKNLPWQDVDAFNLQTMKGGQAVRIQLSSAETFQIHAELTRLYKIAEKGIPLDGHTLEVVDQNDAVIVKGSAGGVLKKLLDEAGDEVWKVLNDLQPHLFKATALVKLHQLREQAVHDFKKHLQANDWNEPAWQKFFEENTWIFGYGLTYRFLSTVQAQPNYGATAMDGKGGQRGDFLMMSEAEKRFTVLVEIKKPISPLLEGKAYRNGAHAVSAELAGAVAQIQKNTLTWELRGASEPENADKLAELRAHTIRPKSILIIGHTRQLDPRAKRESFELFRNSLQTPEIITFDELLERARHLLLNDKKQHTAPEAPEDDEFDIPF